VDDADETASNGLGESLIRQSGREPGMGRQPGDRQANRCTTENARDGAEKGETSQAETELERVTSGCIGGKPKAGKSSRGALGRRDLTNHAPQQHSLGEQGPEVDSRRAGAGQTAGSTEERHEGSGQGKLARLRVGRKTPGERNPERGSGMKQARKVGAEETVEDVRNVEDGASARAGSNRGNPGRNPNGGAGAHVRAAPTEVAKRAKTPREALSGKPGGRARRQARQARKAGGWKRTLKGTKSSREDDPRPEKVGER